MKKLIEVKYFQRGNLNEDILRGIEDEKIVALEIYEDGTIKYVGIKNVVDYIIEGE